MDELKYVFIIPLGEKHMYDYGENTYICICIYNTII